MLLSLQRNPPTLGPRGTPRWYIFVSLPVLAAFRGCFGLARLLMACLGYVWCGSYIVSKTFSFVNSPSFLKLKLSIYFIKKEGNMSFSDIRTSKGLTQQCLADKIGVRQSTVAMWETGKSVPSTKHLVKLSEIFKMELSDLLKSFKKNVFMPK